MGAQLADGADLEAAEAVKLSDHARRNRAEWNAWAAEFVEPGRRAWAAEEISWGIVDTLESDVRVLPDVAGKDVLEAGCGTAYVSAWLARRSARVTGLDLSDAQLATARRFQQEFGLEFPLVHGSAEAMPFADESFDLVVSEYGASIWADPYAWIPEAARVLRPGGHAVFLVNGTLLVLCMPELEAEFPAGTRFERPYFGMHRFEWPDDDSVDFHLGYGDWISLFTATGLEVDDFVELQGKPDAEPSRFNLFAPEWATKWPAEEIWRVRKPR
ncbi:MAG: class I SAM-dependent methyltransferase [Thermoleophilia bacterium]|nr:class I SAM-dependent methyltransferase [Thermoleophilia bacterium]